MASSLRESTMAKRSCKVNTGKATSKTPNTSPKQRNRCTSPTPTTPSCTVMLPKMPQTVNTSIISRGGVSQSHDDNRSSPLFNLFETSPRDHLPCLSDNQSHHSNIACRELIQSLEDRLRLLISESSLTIMSSVNEENELLRTEINHLKEENASLKTTICALKTVSVDGTTQTDITSEVSTIRETVSLSSNDEDNTDATLKSATVERSPSVYPIGVQMTNRTMAQNETTETKNKQIKPSSSGVPYQQPRTAQENQYQDSTHKWQLQSPRRERGQHDINIDPKATHLVIGDSLLKGIYSDRMSPSENETVAVHPLPGAGIDRLTTTLNRFSTNSKIKRTTVHIGINDIMNDKIISKSQLSTLLVLLKSKFAESNFFISSIIIPCHGFQRRLADVANLTLQSFCMEHEVNFINHTPYFTSSSGAPKKRLYRDQIHGSRLGNSILAKNIKYPQRTQYPAPAAGANRTPSMTVATADVQTSLLGPTPNLPVPQMHTLVRHHTSPKPDAVYDSSFPPLSLKQPRAAKPKETSLNNPVISQMPAANERLTRDDHASRPSPYSHVQPAYPWNPELQHLMNFNPAALHQAFMMSLQRRHYPVPPRNNIY